MIKNSFALKALAAVSLTTLVFNTAVLDVSAGNDKYTKLYNATLVTDGTGEFYSDLDDLLWSLPDYVQDIISPYTITLVGDSEYIETHYDDYQYSSVVGLTDFYAKKVYVEAYVDDIYQSLLGDGDSNYNYSKRFTETILIHEIGHIVDDAFGMVSKKSEFSSIYYDEVETFISTEYFRTYEINDTGGVCNAEEYFCTAFACYILSPETLSEVCPLTYEYIKTNEEKYLKNHGYNVNTGTLISTKDSKKSNDEMIYKNARRKIIAIKNILVSIGLES